VAGVELKKVARKIAHTECKGTKVPIKEIKDIAALTMAYLGAICADGKAEHVIISCKRHYHNHKNRLEGAGKKVTDDSKGTDSTVDGTSEAISGEGSPGKSD